MKFSRMRRVCVVASAIAMLALALYMMHCLASFNRNIDLRAKGADNPHAFVAGKRYEPLKPLLPPNDIIRYVTDVPREETRFYYQARFALAPVRVAWEGDYDVAIGDFRLPQNVAPVLRREGYVIEKDLGAGLFLLKKRTR